MADNGKINHEKGMFCAAAWTFPFLNSRIKGYGYGQKKGDSGHDNVCGCIGFVKDRNTRLNVPNTLLKKDIREVTASQVQKVYAVLSKSYTAERYSVLEKVDKGIDMKKCLFAEEMEKVLERGAF